MWQLEGIVYRADDVLLRYDDHYTPDIALDLPVEEDERLSETLATYRALLAAAHQTAGHSTQAATALDGLSRQLEGAEGNLEALQAVGALTTGVASEVTRSNELAAMTLNALVVQYSHELAAREEAERTFLDWIERGRDVQSPRPPRTFELVPDDFVTGR
jgi:conjugal transfer/entry exclusion protein